MSLSDFIQQDCQEVRVHAGKLIAAGEVIGFLTDTFYGLGADPHNHSAVEKVANLKGGREGSPILVLISDEHVAARFLAHRSELFSRLAERFWGGEVTIVEKAKPNLPSNLVSASGTIGLRLPRVPEVRRIVRLCGGALTATSANLHLMPPAQTAAQVANYFPQGLALVVDGGKAKQMQPSTVVDVSEGTARLIREGLISRETIGEVIELA